MLLGSSPNLWPCQMSEISFFSAVLKIFCLTVEFCCKLPWRDESDMLKTITIDRKIDVCHTRAYVCVSNDCGELYVYPHTWILQHIAPGMDNPPPQSSDLGQMLTCRRMEWQKCTSLLKAWGGCTQHAMFCDISCAECYYVQTIWTAVSAEVAV